jgi:hypothetical protein
MPFGANLGALQADRRLVGQVELGLGPLGQPQERRRRRQLVDREFQFDADFLCRRVALP